MYLTRLDLNPSRRTTRALLANPQALHAAIMKACNPAEGERVLWRTDDADSVVRLYVVSPSLPQLQELQLEAGWPDGAPAESASYMSFLNRIEVSNIFAFRLTANPTHVVKIHGIQKRTAHVTVGHQISWLMNKASAHGFEIEPTELADPSAPEQKALQLQVSDRFTRTFRREGKPVTLAVATFSGILTVTDADAIRQALTQGIGRAKAYGCGLLTLAPPQ